MKKHLHLIGIFVLALAMAVSSCKKDDDDDNGGNSPADYLTSGDWKMTGLTVDPPLDFGIGVPISDMYATLEDCDKDDLTTFKSDGIVIFDEGELKCEANAPQSVEGTWSLNSDNSILTINQPEDGNMMINIIELSSSKLKGSYSQEFLPGQIYTFTVTMSK